MSRESSQPLEPMEAESVLRIPVGDEWQYEPKWDGFRCLASRVRGRIALHSKSGQPLNRYFPELVESLEQLRPQHFVLDGEVVIPVAGRLSFDDLLLRVHPAASRIRKLASEHPAIFIVFDLLGDERGRSLLEVPLEERRERLESFAERYFVGAVRVRLSPATRKVEVARKWFRSVGNNLDGLIAKRVDLPYQSGNRDGMQKIKHLRTCDCVVGGFRYSENFRVVGSLLLGLYDDEGRLNHVGFCSNFHGADREKLTARLEKLVKAPGFTGRAPGGKSRWSTRRSEEWHPLAPKLVVEVKYDHFTGGRFRHGTRLLRWRPDKRPRQCTIDQIEQGRGESLKLLVPAFSG